MLNLKVLIATAALVISSTVAGVIGSADSASAECASYAYYCNDSNGNTIDSNGNIIHRVDNQLKPTYQGIYTPNNNQTWSDKYNHGQQIRKANWRTVQVDLGELTDNLMDNNCREVDHFKGLYLQSSNGTQNDIFLCNGEVNGNHQGGIGTSGPSYSYTAGNGTLATYPLRKNHLCNNIAKNEFNSGHYYGTNQRFRGGQYNRNNGRCFINVRISS